MEPVELSLCTTIGGNLRASPDFYVVCALDPVGDQSEKIENSQNRRERKMVQSFRQRVDSKRGRGGERVSAASFHRGRRRGETGTPRLAIGRDGKNARVYDSTRRPIRRNAQTIGRFSARFDRFTDARSIGSKAPRRSNARRVASLADDAHEERQEVPARLPRRVASAPLGVRRPPHIRARRPRTPPLVCPRGDAHSRRRARLRVPSRLLGWGRSVVLGFIHE